MYLLTQIIDQPTRVTSSSNTIIDHIYISNHISPLSSGVVPISISDHYPVYVVLSLQKPSVNNHKTISKRSFKHFSYDSFVHDILYSPVLNTVYDILDICVAWDTFKSEFLRLSDFHAPIHSFRVKNLSNNWINDDILQMMYQRNHLHKIAAKTNNPDKWKEYRLTRNKITNVVRNAKASYYQSKIEAANRDTKLMWNILKQALPSDKYTCQPTTISPQTFNDFFSSVGERLTRDFGDLNIPECNIDTPSVSFSFICIDVNFVLRELLQLSKESKLDVLKFDTKLLRFAAPIIAPLLTHIFNLSLFSGLLPQDWKLARITPIYKGKNDKDDPTNYRPLSVVSPIAKIIEKAVKIQLINYFVQHNLLSPSQSAYLKYHSTQTALHYFTDNLYSNIDSGKIGIACFLDLSKGFDTLNIDILIDKLSKHGISSDITWFKSYLSSRHQIVFSNNNYSEINVVNIGVPQGTVLGPILFLVYINDFSSVIKDAILSLYADDSSMAVFGDNIADATDKLTVCLDNAAHWFKANRLIINTSKSNVMVFRTRQSTSLTPKLDIEFDKNKLQQVQHTKILGVIIDENLTFNYHIEYLKKKISSKIAIIHRLRHTLPISSLNQIYLALMQSVFDYCITIWGNSSKQNVLSVQRLQNRAARAITGIFDYNSSVSEIIKNLNWMNINQRFSYFLAILVYKCLNNLAPDYLSATLHYVSETQLYSTRSASNKHLTLPKPHLSIMKHSFQYSGPQLWNTLPTSIINCSSLQSFKWLLRQHLML